VTPGGAKTAKGDKAEAGRCGSDKGEDMKLYHLTEDVRFRLRMLAYKRGAKLSTGGERGSRQRAPTVSLEQLMIRAKPTRRDCLSPSSVFFFSCGMSIVLTASITDAGACLVSLRENGENLIRAKARPEARCGNGQSSRLVASHARAFGGSPRESYWRRG